MKEQKKQPTITENTYQNDGSGNFELARIQNFFPDEYYYEQLELIARTEKAIEQELKINNNEYSSLGDDLSEVEIVIHKQKGKK